MAKLKFKDRLTKFFGKQKPQSANGSPVGKPVQPDAPRPVQPHQSPMKPPVSPASLPLLQQNGTAHARVPSELPTPSSTGCSSERLPSKLLIPTPRNSHSSKVVVKGEANDHEALHRNTSLGSQASGQGSPSSRSHSSQQETQIVERIHANGHSKSNSEAELEEIVAVLRDGTVDSRSAAAEKLFNKAAEDETARQRTATLGVVQPLVRLLYDGKERGRMYAAYALSSIMTPSQPLADMRAAGVIPALITVLNTSKVLASKKGAMRALGRLARSDDSALEIVEANGLPPIIALLDCEDSGLVRRCLVALYFIGADKEPLQAAMNQMGVVAPVVRLCRSTQPEIQAEAADVIKVLSRHARAATVIAECGGLDALAQIAERGASDRAKTSATKAIQRLAAAPGLEARVRASAAGTFLTTTASSIEGQGELIDLADLLTRGPLYEREQAAQAITAATAADPTVSTDLAGAGIVKSLVQMLNNGGVQGQISAARALTNMAADQAVQDQIMALGAVPHLVGIMRDNVGAAPAAAGAVEKLAGQPRFAAAIIRQGGVSALVGLLNAGAREAFLPTMRSLKLLSSLDPNVAQGLVKAEGVTPLIRRSAKGSTDVRIAALSVLRDIAKNGHSLVEPGGVAILAALEHSSIQEVRNLSTSTLNMQATADARSAQAVSVERNMQERIGALISEVRVSTMVPLALEEAIRVVPRSAFLPPDRAHDGFKNKGIRIVEADVLMGSPSVEALALQALNPEVGHAFLDVGSGSGYLTMLAAHMVAYSGNAVGVDIRESVVEYAEAKVREVKEKRGLADLSLTFLRGSIFGHPSLPVMGRFDRIHVGANCPKSRLRDLLRLLKPGGKMAVACEGQLLLLVQPSDGPVPEPTVLGSLPQGDILVDDMQQGGGALVTSPSQRPFPSSPVPKIFTSPNESPASMGGQPSWPSPQKQNGAMENSGLPRLPRPSVHEETDPLPGRRPSRERDEGEDRYTPPDEDHGWFISRDDIRICRNIEGRKCRLGEGGFGVVYKALMNGVDEVAVKLVKADKPTQKEMSLFHKEVRVLRQLHHRNIVQFYGANLDPGSMFFVTELMKGGDLYSALRHHPETMRWDRLGKKVALDTALGINYLHTRKPPMMHRDLKSPNVLLSEEGVAKIADVGMVRAQVKDLMTAQPVMTPLWAAPEVIRHERASVKADMWSYGVLIWELVSGQDITEMQPLAIARQMHGPARGKTLELPPNCPSIAKCLFDACTQMNPDNRPTASKVVEWLRHPGV